MTYQSLDLEYIIFDFFVIMHILFYMKTKNCIFVENVKFLVSMQKVYVSEKAQGNLGYS